MIILSKLLAPAVWTSLVGAGLSYAWRYETTAGVPAPPSDWPAATTIGKDAALPTIVMFAHPHCPCTKVGIEQLGELVARNPGRARLVFVVGTPGLSELVAASQSARAAQRIPGAIVLPDSTGAEAKRFGAATSGQVVAFAPSGARLFRGGLTVARGHYGANAGIDALDSILNSRRPQVVSTPVFGCSLSTPSDTAGVVR